jgi:hypothetical protein
MIEMHMSSPEGPKLVRILGKLSPLGIWFRSFLFWNKMAPQVTTVGGFFFFGKSPYLNNREIITIYRQEVLACGQKYNKIPKLFYFPL